MKILHVMAGGARGGAETFFQDCITALHDSGVSQSVVTRDNHDHKINLIRDRNISLRTTSFNRYWRLPTSVAIKKSAEAFGPDIIQYWMTRAGSYGIRTAAKNIAWYGAYYRPHKYKHADAHVAVTRDVADHIVAQGISSEKVFVLNTYAEFPKATAINRADFDTPDDVPLLLALSRLHPLKGIDVLLQALAKVPEAYLWIAGSGAYEKQLKTLCHDLGLDSRVRFLGWREDRGALMETADIFVFPTRKDSFGTVMVEAWGHNTPIIAARAKGPEAFIEDGKNGLLTDIGDADELADAINQLISNPKLRGSLIQGGAKIYQNSFTKKVFQQNAADLYDAVMRLKL